MGKREAAARDPLEGLQLPTMPASLQQVQEEKRRPEPDFDRVTGIIAGDVALAAEVLKVVNSPAFGLRSRISSIPSAVMMLGFPNVLNVATAAALRGTIDEPSLGRFWDTALDVGLTAAELARRYTGIPPDKGYTLGLFHDCGIPLLMRRFPNYRELIGAAYGQSEVPISRYEEARLEVGHAYVGYAMARAWYLPKDVCLAIRYHHDCVRVCSLEEGEHGDVVTMVAILSLAEHISNEFRRVAFRPDGEDIEWERNRSRVLARLDLSGDDYEDLREELLLNLGQQ